jgi:hypothetical protein
MRPSRASSARAGRSRAEAPERSFSAVTSTQPCSPATAMTSDWRLHADWMCYAAGQWYATTERRTWSQLTPSPSSVSCERWRCPSEPGSFSIGTGHARREPRQWSRWMGRTWRTIAQPAPSPSGADPSLIPHKPRFAPAGATRPRGGPKVWVYRGAGTRSGRLPVQVREAPDHDPV